MVNEHPGVDFVDLSGCIDGQGTTWCCFAEGTLALENGVGTLWCW